MVTNRQIDRVIALAKPVRIETVKDEITEVVVVSRDRWCFNCASGERFDRTDIRSLVWNR